MIFLLFKMSNFILFKDIFKEFFLKNVLYYEDPDDIDDNIYFN